MSDNCYPLDLSITLVSHNHRVLIEKYLPSIFTLESKVSFEMLLIDNACTDGTADWVCKTLPQVRVIRHKKPESYAFNMNRGMQLLTKGRYFVVLNPDIQCLPGLFDEAVAFMASHPDVGIMGPQLLNPDGTIQASCRTFSTPLSILIRGLHLDGLFKNKHWVSHYLMSDYDHGHVCDVDWITGALMFVRRQAIDAVGGMDERYESAYSEDQDWCCRMWRTGWRVVYVPQSRAVHDHLRAGMRKPWSKMGRVQIMNAIRMFHKFNWQLSREAY